MRKLLTVITLLAIISEMLLSFPLTPFAQAEGGYNPSVVGGVDETQIYEDQKVAGFLFTSFTFRSHYPAGMEFSAVIEPPEGVTISRVKLSYTFSNTGRSGEPAAVRPGVDSNEWIATFYEYRGLTPWHDLDVFWEIRTTDGSTITTEPVHAVYYDATREWYRAESNDIVAYWFGISETLGKYVIDAMATNREKYLQGFGIPLPYRPVAIIYPPGGIWNEYQSGAVLDDTDFGSTGTIIFGPGSTVQRVRTLEPATIRKDCIWNPKTLTEEFQLNQAASEAI